MIQSAEKQADVVYWGTVGFSVRVKVPGSDSLASIAYGYPPNLFQVYFGHLPFPEERISQIREEMLALGIFKQSPKTLACQLNSTNLQRAEEAYALMRRRVMELS
jgi:hypothetical protein